MGIANVILHIDDVIDGVIRVMRKPPQRQNGEDGLPMQPGDVPVTYADTAALERDFGFCPHTPLRDGLRKFAEWYRDFYME